MSLNIDIDDLPEDWTLDDLYPRDMKEAPMITIDSQIYREALTDPDGPKSHEYALNKAQLLPEEQYRDPIAETLLKERK